MASEISIAREVDGILSDWRARVLQILLVVVSVLAPLPLLAILAGRVIFLPWPLRRVCLCREVRNPEHALHLTCRMPAGEVAR